MNFNVQSFPQLFDEDHCWADSHTFILPVNGDRDEDETKAAVEFMVAACKDGGLTWAGSGQIPANTEVTGNEEYAALPYRSNYQDEVEKAVLPAKNPHFYAMKDGMIQSWIPSGPAPMMQQPVLMHLLTSCLLTWNKA